ncbi:hypothetical protein HPP92_011842 [Vanilla planifolia]|uniref:Uncharacterized protein n=1 Tax=Vanilla planifolia TaxID=51239 RepID=A0A835UYU3_VANPL|nr:hypothetical protein HPP92_011842 [Vanilla planifolia]
MSDSSSYKSFFFVAGLKKICKEEPKSKPPALCSTSFIFSQLTNRRRQGGTKPLVNYDKSDVFPLRKDPAKKPHEIYPKFGPKYWISSHKSKQTEGNYENFSMNQSESTASIKFSSVLRTTTTQLGSISSQGTKQERHQSIFMGERGAPGREPETEREETMGKLTPALSNSRASTIVGICLPSSAAVVVGSTTAGTGHATAFQCVVAYVSGGSQDSPRRFRNQIELFAGDALGDCPLARRPSGNPHQPVFSVVKGDGGNDGGGGY